MIWILFGSEADAGCLGYHFSNSSLFLLFSFSLLPSFPDSLFSSSSLLTVEKYHWAVCNEQFATYLTQCSIVDKHYYVCLTQSECLWVIAPWLHSYAGPTQPNEMRPAVLTGSSARGPCTYRYLHFSIEMKSWNNGMYTDHASHCQAQYQIRRYCCCISFVHVNEFVTSHCSQLSVLDTQRLVDKFSPMKNVAAINSINSNRFLILSHICTPDVQSPYHDAGKYPPSVQAHCALQISTNAINQWAKTFVQKQASTFKKFHQDIWING